MSTIHDSHGYCYYYRSCCSLTTSLLLNSVVLAVVTITAIVVVTITITIVLFIRVSENRGPENSTLNSRILIIRTPN